MQAVRLVRRRMGRSSVWTQYHEHGQRRLVRVFFPGPGDGCAAANMLGYPVVARIDPGY